MLVAVGCGTINTAFEGRRVADLIANKQDPRHVRSCGPTALKKVLSHLNIKEERKEISRIIQERGHECRSFLSIFHHRARGISFESDIKHVLKLYGFKTREVSSLSDLDPNKDVAIVLISKKWTLLYHWMAFPNNLPIEKYHGDCTKIHAILVVEKEVFLP
tara:strand:- start:436 stop:918 length:483 start_codon:yes stop_codon:yes gene_type:complete